MVNYNDIEVTDKVSWNLSMPLLQQIGNNLQDSNNNFLNGRIEKAFFCLKVIRMRIIHSLNKDERKLCADIEKRFKRNPHSNINQKSKYYDFKNEQYTLYDDFNTLIMDLLEKYGYTIKEQEDNTNINT